jgi:Dyp-type peroxidase family
MTDPQIPLDLDQIQGNILAGFNKNHQAFMFLRLGESTAARSWMAAIAPQIATSAEVGAFNALFKSIRRRRGVPEPGTVEATWLNLAFTHSGLRAMGVGEQDLALFPSEFQQGMPARAAQIGDVGDSDPSRWIPPLRGVEIHVVLLIASDARDDMHKEIFRQTRHAAAADITVLYVEEGKARVDQPGHEHFGFKDGVSQPGIRGFTESTGTDPDEGKPGQDLLWPGEFVLGYPRQRPAHTPPPPPGGYGPQPPQPTAESVDSEPGDVSVNGPDWCRNGSYLVFRRLRQDVPGFKAFVQAQAQTQGISTDLFGAKLVGRYASGAPLERTEDEAPDFDPQAPDPSLADPTLLDDDHNNNFEFSHDPDGALVPRAAHIRKAYPRDEATPSGGEADTQTHRLLRRGIAFGEPYSSHARGHSPHSGNPDFPHDRGLLFVCYGRSIAEQFEFVQARWVNDPNFPQPGDRTTPLSARSMAPVSSPFRAAIPTILS